MIIKSSILGAFSYIANQGDDFPLRRDGHFEFRTNDYDEAYLDRYDYNIAKFVKQDIDCADLETSKPLSCFVANSHALYYLGEHHLQGANIPLLMRFDLTTGKATVLRAVDHPTRKVLTILIIEDKPHTLILDTITAGYELVEISESGAEIVIKQFKPIEELAIKVDLDLQDPYNYHNWYYDITKKAIVGVSEQRNATTNKEYGCMVSFDINSGRSESIIARSVNDIIDIANRMSAI